MGFKDFLMRKVIESKMKNVPKEQQEQIVNMVTKNPELFEKIGKEIEQKKKEGKSEMSAAMEVMRKYQNEIRDAMQKE